MGNDDEVIFVEGSAFWLQKFYRFLQIIQFILLDYTYSFHFWQICRDISTKLHSFFSWVHLHPLLSIAVCPFSQNTYFFQGGLCNFLSCDCTDIHFVCVPLFMRHLLQVKKSSACICTTWNGQSSFAVCTKVFISSGTIIWIYFLHILITAKSWSHGMKLCPDTKKQRTYNF